MLDPLERDRLLESTDADLVREEYLGHAACRELPDDLVLPQDHLVRDGLRRGAAMSGARVGHCTRQ